MAKKILKNILKNETVFCVSLLLAVLSAFFVRPDETYLSYPDWRTIALLFCLMILVAGLRSKGVFTLLGHVLLRKAGSLRALSAVMVLLCFFSSMIITNDVTLLTFVPFTMLVFRMTGNEERIVKLVVLETIGANLGSMATPIGNPQNLYLYSVSKLTAGQFAGAVLPYAGLSLLLLVAAAFAGRDEPLMEVELGKRTEKESGRAGKRLAGDILPFLLLLVLCLLVVFRMLPYLPVLFCVAVVVMLLDLRLYLEVDYFLLFTFLFFFIFVGNMKRIPLVSEALVSAVEGRELLTGVLASQVMSNVPAAILLSGFTDRIQPLLTGVNLGGLGTLIASLASLISYKIVTREYPQSRGSFMKVFTFWNVLFLALLLLEALLLGGV